jgi:pterin-4a-carbinolamine dehydratase
MTNGTNKLIGGQIVLLVLIIFSAGGMVFQVNSLAQDVEDNSHHPVSKAEVEVMKVKQDAIRRDVGEIKADVKDMDEKIDEILEAVK